VDQSLEVTVLLPCRNEAATIQGCVAQAREFLERSGIAGEVVVVDNGSQDDSAALAAAAGARVVHEPEAGYGSALNTGIGAAGGRYVIMGDADASYDLANLDPYVARLRQGAELVVGNRFLGGIEPGAMPLLHRWLGNPALSWLGRRLFHVPLGDFHCGLRGFETTKVRALGLRTTGMEWASELIVRAAMEGLAICEVPTTLARDGRPGRPHLRTWSDGWRHLRFLLLLSPRWLFLYPGIALTLLGLTLTTILTITPIEIGGVGFDVATLLYSVALTLLGSQLLAFAAITRALSARLGLPTSGHRHASPTTDAEPRSARWTLERGLAAGTMLLVAGGALALISIERWRATGFAELDPRSIIRLVAPTVLLLLLGAQTVAASLLRSVLSVATRDGAR
jgi:hypothetical protein